MLKKIAIIGAGISGLTCAYELQKAGFEVTIFEANDYVGGRMASRKKDTFTFDIGVDHLCNLYDEMKKYVSEFGLTWEKMRNQNYNILKKGKLIPLGQSIGLLSRIRLAWLYLKIPKTGSFFNLSEMTEYDDDNAYDFMKKAVGQEIADYFVDPFTTTYEFHRSKKISKGVLFGVMHSIKNDRKRWSLYRIKGGMSALPEAFADRLKVKLSTPVLSVKTDDAVTVETKDETESFDAAVIATTGINALRLLKSPTAVQKDVLENTKYASSITISFKVPTKVIPDIYICWVPFVESRKISGYVNEAMKGEDDKHGGKQLVNCWLHEDFAKSIMDKSDEEIFAAVEDEFQRVSPWLKVDVHTFEHNDIQRWPEAEPKFEQGHITRVKNFLENGQGENNVFLTGDYLNSPWAEGALRCGQRTARQVIEQLHS